MSNDHDSAAGLSNEVGGHAMDESHHALHDFLSMIFLIVMLLSQAGVIFWKKYHPRSFLRVTLFGVWVLPFGIAIFTRTWGRMLVLNTIFTAITGYLFFKASRKPLDKRTPRLVYRWFHVMYLVSYGSSVLGYVLIMFEFLVLSFFQSNGQFASFGLQLIMYGLYFGVLDRDCAELCTDIMASEMGIEKKGMPTRPLPPNICVICNEPLLVISANGVLREKEPIRELDCKHQCHEFCLRGWSMIGKKDTCPYPLCREKVQIKNTFENPWQAQSVLWMHLLDMVRYMLVWYPLIMIGTQYGLSYFDADFFEMG